VRTYTPAEVFSPGEYLRDELKERAWPDDRFAEILDLPIEETSEILDGKREVTEEIAGALSKALGTTPELWLNLQREYLRFQPEAGFLEHHPQKNSRATPQNPGKVTSDQPRPPTPTTSPAQS